MAQQNLKKYWKPKNGQLLYGNANAPHGANNSNLSSMQRQQSKSERAFLDSIRGYLKPKTLRNTDGMRYINHNGYIAEAVPWQNFDPKLFSNGKAYLFYLPWNTSLLWIPQWLDRITANNLKNTILERVKYEVPTLRFDKRDKNGKVIGVTEVKQPRKTAWISNEFNQRCQERADSDTLP